MQHLGLDLLYRYRSEETEVLIPIGEIVDEVESVNVVLEPVLEEEIVGVEGMNVVPVPEVLPVLDEEIAVPVGRIAEVEGKIEEPVVLEPVLEGEIAVPEVEVVHVEENVAVVEMHLFLYPVQPVPRHW